MLQQGQDLSKDVLRVSEVQRPAKLHSFKHWDLNPRVWFNSDRAAEFFSKPPNLTACNFAALCSRETHSIVLERLIVNMNLAQETGSILKIGFVLPK